MRFGRAGLAAGALLIGPATAAPPAPPPAGAGLCVAGERALFGCMAGAKAVAVCAAGKAVHYRYGLPGKVELGYPGAGVAGTGTLYRAQAAYSGGGEAQIGFTQGPFRYVVYSRVVRTGFDARGDDTAFEAGVMILQGARHLADRRCTRPADADVDLPTAETLLPEGEITDASE